ncbi:hypothetical protein Ddc_01580 [Ditylenchus destructor]|nr:hypothetical protein Ddc_01580 [Ditylenchus destructor]
METPCDENLSNMENFYQPNLADDIFEYDRGESPVENRCYQEQTELYAGTAKDALCQESTIISKDILLDTFRFLPRKNLDILQEVCRMWNIFIGNDKTLPLRKLEYFIMQCYYVRSGWIRFGFQCQLRKPSFRPARFFWTDDLYEMDVTKYLSLKEKILAESQFESKFHQRYRDYGRTPYEVYDAEGRIKNGYDKGIVGRIDIDYYTFEYALPTILQYLRNCYVSFVRLDFGFYAVSGRICQRIVELLEHTNVISEVGIPLQLQEMYPDQPVLSNKSMRSIPSEEHLQHCRLSK